MINNMRHKFWALIIALSLAIGAGASITACDSTDDDATAAPAAFAMPNGGQCYGWMNNPHETDGFGPACPFAMPQSQPVRQPGMSDMDFAILGGLFGYYMGHHSYYNRPWYYDNYIGPAWTRYPSGNYLAYPGHPVTRITTVNNYTTIVHGFDTKYAAQEKQYTSNPKYSTYKTANGKSYTGATVPKKAFSGTNVPVKKSPLGNAGYSNSNNSSVKNPTNNSTKPSTSTNIGNSKTGYGKSYGKSGGGSWFSGGSNSGTKSYGGFSGGSRGRK